MGNESNVRDKRDSAVIRAVVVLFVVAGVIAIAVVMATYIQ